MQAAPNQPGFPMPKLEILLFDELNPRWLVRRYERMFSLYNVLDQQRVTLAFAYVNDAGDVWFQGWSRVRGDCQWADFVEDLCEKYGDRSMMDVLEKFNKLMQEGTVQTYQLKFEELKSLMLNLNPQDRKSVV